MCVCVHASARPSRHTYLFGSGAASSEAQAQVDIMALQHAKARLASTRTQIRNGPLNCANVPLVGKTPMRPGVAPALEHGLQQMQKLMMLRQK